MDYGRLKPTPSARFSENISHKNHTQNPLITFFKKYCWVIILSIIASLILATITSIVVINVKKHHQKQFPSTNPNNNTSSSNSHTNSPNSKTPSSSRTLIQMCELTRYPNLCVTSLKQYAQNKQVHGKSGDNYYNVEGANNKGYDMDQGTIMDLSFNMTLDRLRLTLDHLNHEFNKGLNTIQWSANDDCVELLNDSMDLLTRARPLLLLISSSNSTKIQSYKTNLMTWMATACTNYDTCTEGFEEAGGAMKTTAQILQELSQILQIHQDLTSHVLDNVVVTHKQVMGFEPTSMDQKNCGNPTWMSTKNTIHMTTLLNNMQANITVSKDGIGPNVTVTTITEAINLAPEHSVTPFIIHIKAGRYEENKLRVIKEKTNLWFIGDGKGKTIITGHSSHKGDNVTTMKTPTFGAIGDGFMARDITFENTAGPENGQAVALLVKSNQAVVYECEVKGYQDTLYVHSNHQYYRNCDIYGTIDFIFGNANAVFQNCTIYALKPMKGQAITITAQKRSSTCPNAFSGISVHKSKIIAAPDLEPLKHDYQAYLGRPWGNLSTVVFIYSFIDDLVNPQGWTPWNSSTPMDHVFYGEYKNCGPGSNTSQRIKSPGVHPNLSRDDAMQFTVNGLLGGSTWINSTMVPVEGGLQ